MSATPREAPAFVPYHFLFGRRTAEFPPPPSGPELDLSRVKPATKEAVAHAIEEKLKRPLAPEENAPDVTFMQLGLDSLDAMEVSLNVEQRFGFSADTVPATVGQLWALAEGLVDKGPPKLVGCLPPADIDRCESRSGSVQPRATAERAPSMVQASYKERR